MAPILTRHHVQQMRDMQDTDPFLSLVQIAGVFVGFGALIAVRSGGAREAHEVTYIRVVVTTGLWVVVAALAPVVISRYGVAGHEIWLACSLVALVLFWAMLTSNRRSPEHQVDMATYTRAEVVGSTIIIVGLLTVPLNAALILVVLGLFPDVESALYFTYVVLILVGAGWALLELVYRQRRAASA